MRHTILFAFFLLLAPSLSTALDMTSIRPATTSPGATVTLTGGPFSDQTVVVLGNRDLVPTSQTVGQVQVQIPEDAEIGDYVIYLAEGQDTSREAFILHLVEPRPSIAAIFPDTVAICQPDGSSPALRIEGSGFVPHAKVLVDGAAVQPSASGRDFMEINLPPLMGGSHNIKVINPSGSTSIPQNFVVDTQPEITQISEGEDMVSSYQLIINGRNFHPKLQLSVGGRIIPQHTGNFDPPNNDTFEYVDCGTLLYNRFQVTGQLSRTSFRIQNPGGQQSAGYEATIR